MSDDPHNLTTKAEAGADDKRSGKPTTGGRGYNARAGETIAGNLARGGDGKFTSAGNASAAKPKPTAGQRAVDLQRRSQKPPKGRAAAKPKKGPKGPDPAKAAERAKRRAEAEARRQQRQQDKLDRAVEQDKKKRQQLADRETRADQQAKRRQEVEARRAKREADKLAREAKPKPGGGGGKGGGAKPKPDAGQDDAKAQEERAANRAKVGATLGRDLNPLADLADGLQPDKATADSLVTAGLAERQSDGSLTTTASARAMLRAAERGDERQARAFMQRAAELQAQQASREAKRQPKPTTAPPPRGQGYGTRYRSFTVYKDRTTGRLRWLAVSSTAFKDRDGEIVSVAALQKDVARSDARGTYGPLRWWHVPGLDIGDCDFRAVYSRSLIESGTFRDDRYAAAIKERDQMSLGFLHAVPVDPVFDDIFTFERSVIPFPEGRGSNLFTRLVVKEAQMLTEAKKAALASRVGPDILAELLAQVDATEKSADAAGIAYKSTDAPPVGTVATWDGEAWVTEKAAPPAEMPAEIDAKAEGDLAVDEEIIEEEMPADEGGTFVGDMSPDEFMGMLTSGIAAALALLTEALNIEAKMRGVIDEVKSTVGAYTAQKDATVAEQAAAIEALKAAQDKTAAQVAELTGDQPRAAGFRASQSEKTVVGEGHALKDAQPQVITNYVEFFGLGQQPPAAQ